MVNEKISWSAISWAHYFQQKNYNSITFIYQLVCHETKKTCIYDSEWK